MTRVLWVLHLLVLIDTPFAALVAQSLELPSQRCLRSVGTDGLLRAPRKCMGSARMGSNPIRSAFREFILVVEYQVRDLVTGVRFTHLPLLLLSRVLTRPLGPKFGTFLAT
jgi:hypothetical protein